jgi:hypothetical protein
MKVAILHYHLRSGGVTSVIRRQVAALREGPEVHDVVLLCGSAPDGPPGAPVEIIEGLDYAGAPAVAGRGGETAERALAANIGKALKRAFPTGCDLLHVHNPLIRKNAALLGALAALADSGQRLFIQVHDLAEDFRPDVYDAEARYPSGCDYAVINSRDREALVTAGLPPEAIHYLPNAIIDPGFFEARTSWDVEKRKGRRIVLYPVRAIRRKNIGEALLLSRFLPSEGEIAVTLPPTSPQDASTYRLWKEEAATGHYPLRFEAGLGSALESLYRSSFRALTTSVKEGFGFTFLDPLVRGIPVVGRSVPYVIEDFRLAGVAFSELYGKIRIPRSALPAKVFEGKIRARIAEFHRAYAGAGMGAAVLDPLLERLTSLGTDEHPDFAALDAELQHGLLRALAADRGLMAAIVSLNPFLPRLFEASPAPGETVRDREAILAAFSQERYRDRLLDAYRRAADGGHPGSIDKRILLEKLLVTESFFLVAA